MIKCTVIENLTHFSDSSRFHVVGHSGYALMSFMARVRQSFDQYRILVLSFLLNNDLTLIRIYHNESYSHTI